jgi:hypothetical protein
VAQVAADTPHEIRRLLARCLHKDADRRLHDIADARIEIEDVLSSPSSVAATAVVRTSRRMLASMLVPALVLVGSLPVSWWTRNRSSSSETTPAPSDARITRLTELPGLEEFPAISPDGRSVVFTAGVNGRRQLFVQLLAGGSPLAITRDPIDHQFPRWSPDSSSILYFSPGGAGDAQGNVWAVPALGGVPRRIGRSVGGAGASATDKRLALFQLFTRGIQLVIASLDGSVVDVVAEFPSTTYYLPLPLRVRRPIHLAL